MSDSNNLAVKITADVQDLTAKFAVARANVNALTAEMNALARQSAHGILDPAGAAKMQQVAGEMLQARQAAAGMAAQLQAAGGSTESFAEHMSHMRGGVSGAARELRTLFDDLQRGNTGGADVAMLRLAQHLLGLSPAALIGLAAIAGLTAGLGYLIVKSIEASRALDQIKVNADVAGNFDITSTAVNKLATELSSSADISRSGAIQIENALAGIPGMTEESLGTASRFAAEYVTTTGQDAEKTSQYLEKMLNPHVKAASYANELAQTHDLSQEQLNLAATADATGNRYTEMAAKLEIANEVFSRGTAAVAAGKANLSSHLGLLLALTAGEGDSITVEELQSEVIASETEKRTANSAAIRAETDALAHRAATPQQKLETGLEAAKKENPVVQQVAEARVSLAEMSGAIDAAKNKAASLAAQAMIDPSFVASAKAAADDLRRLTAAMGETQEKIGNLTFGPVIERMREQIAQVGSTWDGTQTGMLQKQLEIASSTLSSVSSNAKERIAVETEVANLTKQLRQSEGAEVIEATREANELIASDTKLSKTQQLEAERENLLEELNDEHLTASQIVEVRRELNSTTVALVRERANEEAAIERSRVTTDVAISRMQIEAQKSALDEELAMHQISASEKYETLRELTEKEYALDLQELQHQRDAAVEGTLAWAEACNKIRELQEKLNVDLAALHRQEVADAQRAAQQEATAWKEAVGEIEGAETTMLGDLLSKRKNFGQAALQAVGQLADKEIEADARAATTRLLIQDQNLAATKAAEQGGLLWHELTQLLGTNATKTAQTQQTAATEAGVTTRTATETAGNSSFFSLIAQAISRWFGGETAKTGATTTGAGTRTTTQAAADAASAVTTKMTALEEINAYAATGAAAAGASVAAIPFYGWAMAGPTAEATYQELSSFATMLSFDRGAWEIPADTVAQVHAGEMVIPAEHSEAIRGALGGGAGFDALRASMNAAAGVAGPGGYAGAPGAAATFHELLVAGIAAPGLDSQSVDRARSESLDQTRSITELQRTASESMRSELTERASSRAFTESIESVRADANLGLPDIAHASLRPEVAQSALLARSSDAAARPSASAEALRAASEGAGGDTFGDTHFTANFHAQEFDGKRITEHLQKMVRNAHPATLRPWLPRR